MTINSSKPALTCPRPSLGYETLQERKEDVKNHSQATRT